MPSDKKIYTQADLDKAVADAVADAFAPMVAILDEYKMAGGLAHPEAYAKLTDIIRQRGKEQ